jgi:hypothetical protein
VNRAATGAFPETRPGTATGSATDSPQVIEKILTRKIGTARLQQWLSAIERGDRAAQSSSNASVWYDSGRPRTSTVDASRPGGTPLFQENQRWAISHPTLKPATVEDAKAEVKNYGSYGGGVAVESIATGLGKIDSTRYDTRFNAFILNDRAAYFLKIPPKTAAVLCRAIAEDDAARVAVSLAAKPIVYGKVPDDSDLAVDLEMADHFLGNIVFADDEWVTGYRLANGFKPRPGTDQSVGHAVHFRLSGFRFQVEDEEVHLADVNFDIQIVPLSKSSASDGGLLPDYALIAAGHRAPEYEANAKHLIDNFSYYRRERIVERMLIYGEVASFIRALKQAGFDLRALAAHIPGG